ncbi:tetratricopeptide repeat protein [uncultured Draconibacterium sp.]|uniref:tetratricopeptide repeat protein n=1 Tax=uncultured Draconibacterium sp. TaxID=1573823 RepID=UPI002AA8E3CE|nr:tetratricopeptide repeat protein [uncultured Draconibacterium sp.]
MTKGLALILIVTGFLFFGVSCRFQAQKVEPILERAEALLETHPDSALVLLNEIANPQSLRKSMYYHYFLVQIQAKYKSDQDITADSLVFKIRDYYADKNNIEKAALATYYSGRVYQERKDYEKALEQFFDTNQFLKESDNFNLKGLCESAIGRIYYDQLLKEKAITHFKLAKDYFHQAQNYKNEISESNSIGSCLLMMDKKDSAFAQYNEALALADKHKIENLQSALRQGLGVAYREVGNWEVAEKYFKESTKYSTDSLNSAKLAANLAGIYQQQEKNDSAIVYLQKALSYMLQEEDNYVAATIYNKWSTIEENKGNYREALDKYKLYSDYVTAIFDENKNRVVLDIEAKYNFQLIENQNKQLLIDKQRILLLSLTLLLVLALLILLVLRRSVLKERKLKDAERKIYRMQEMARSFNEKENSYRNVLIRHFDILKKAALLEGYLKEDEKRTGKNLLRKFNDVVYGQKELDWNIIYDALNTTSNGFLAQLKNRFPQLDDSEFRVCCLIFVDFSNTEIALVLNYRLNTVEVKKSTIRKKLNIESRGNIRDFLIETGQCS